jgi:hypothetical protein
MADKYPSPLAASFAAVGAKVVMRLSVAMGLS